MACTRKLLVWAAREGGSVSFKPIPGVDPQLIPCNKCPDCRASLALGGGTRAYGELTSHDKVAFITLTYSQEYLDAHKVLLQNPHTGRYTIHPLELRRLWSRFRKKHPHIRYYACGEYGEQYGRPHYHAIIFGWWPSDAVLYAGGNDPAFHSEELDDIWQRRGLTDIRHANFATVSYVAGYVTKKLVGVLGALEYSDIFPPFVRQSQSLGRDFLHRYLKEFTTTGLVTISQGDGSARQVPVPRAWLLHLRRQHWVEDLNQPHTRSPYESLRRARAAEQTTLPDQDTSQHDMAHEMIREHESKLRSRGKL